MKMFRFLICAYMVGVLCHSIAAQNSNQTRRWLHEDSIRLQSMIEKSKFMPDSIEEIIHTLKNVELELCKEKDGQMNREQCNKIRRDVEELSGVLVRVNKEVQIARQSLSLLVHAFWELQTQTLNPAEYSKLRSRFHNKCRNYEKHLKKVKRTERSAVFGVAPYILRNYWRKEPFVLIMSQKYLYETIQSKKNIEENLNNSIAHKQKINLELYTVGQEIQQANAKTDAHLHLLRDTLQRLTHQHAYLRKQQEALNTDISIRRDTLERMYTSQKEKERMIYNLDKDHEKKRQRYTEEDSTLTMLLKTLNKERVQVENTLDQSRSTVSSLQADLQDKKQKLHHLQDSIARINAELDDKSPKAESRKRIGIVGVIWGALALVIIFTQYQRILTARRVRKKLERNKVEIEQKNQQLAEKSANLEQLVQRLQHSTEELNHRTKNNLQQVSSMLLMQYQKTSDTEAKEALLDARSRIDVLGLLHRQMYKTQKENYTRVELNDYITALVQQLVRVNAPDSKQPSVHISIEKVEVKMERAVHIGLLFNELVQNIFKHAFPFTEEPRLETMLFTVQNSIHIIVRDNGPGMPDRLNQQQDGSFGLELVNIIVDGLEGTVRYANEPGATFYIEIPWEGDEP